MFRPASKIKLAEKCKKILFAKTRSESLVTSSVNLPESADVVIIGGGSAGCNGLYHLSRQGAKVVLVEKSKLTSGTTWHTAGLFWSLRPSDVEIELLNGTLRTIAGVEKQTGEHSGFKVNGSLFIARSDTRLDEYKRLVTAGKAYGVESHMISPREAQDLFPLLDGNAITGAIYTPADGAMDPAMLISALTKAAKQNGAKIFEDCPVTKILTNKSMFGSKKITGVETACGVIKTNCVLNASGAWSKNISRMLDVEIPLVPMKHAYVVSEPMEGVQGSPNIRDHDGNIYFRVQGEALCFGGYEKNPIVLQSAPKDFSFSLYELDWNIFESHFTSAAELIPRMAKVGIRSTVCGPESFTPDHKPIMGEDPRCAGFFHSCGFNSAGMMLGGGCGEQIAKWILQGRPDKHMFHYDIRRFTPDQTKDSIWTNERSHEAYAKNYSIVFPNDQPLSGRNFQKSPFHDALIKEGAVMEEKQGWERPGWFLAEGTVEASPYDYQGSYGSSKNEQDQYATILKQDCTFDFPKHHNIMKEEVLACRNNAVLFDMSYFGKFYLSGPEVQTAADYIFTADTNRELNKTVYTCILNEQGGVEGDCTVTAIEAGSSGVVDPIFKGKSFYIVTGGASAYYTWCHIKKILEQKKFGVSFHKVTDQIGILSIQGPRSREILQSLVNEDLSNEKLEQSTSKLMTINGCNVRVFRLSFVGELGYELHIPNQHCQAVYDAIMARGKQYNLKLAGYRALYSLSSEKGYHLWDSDLRSDDNPIESGLGFLCRKNDQYQGSDAIEEFRKNGILKKLVHFHMEEQIPLWGLETIYRNNRVVGYIRRGDYAFTFGQSIGRGYVKHPDGQAVTEDFLTSGTYEIEVMGKKCRAKAYLRSPFDAANKRIKGEYEDSA